ncbi:DUF547 domain-containing protein [Allomuricauda sp. SCSIO 65647]|uniref:DUF547 domain-containing protein n=1 Tax=Allomuricauda sp. SCSIO 65647 TaxID=2908843 RepID=UPI001F246A21|nr:DUF547 domain-containing protein [Muricauda sp. SCSIO 65647]UJH67755.1 DUF547 domain-containing protein [Muricauda sp. SCSIO 65647]
MKTKLIVILFMTALSCCKVKKVDFQGVRTATTDFNRLSEDFLQYTIDGKNTKTFQEQLANTTVDELANALTTDEQRYAFWVNIYNAYILVVLSENPEFYEDKGAFFGNEQLNIAGEMVSFEKIEHGILRKSQWSNGLGYVRKWFPDRLERKLRVEKRDYRIHFALNCGAKDCPPVAIYNPDRIKEQFEVGTRTYLARTSSYDKKTSTVKVTSLFSWFRGDFGGKSGIKNILKDHGIIPDTKGVDIEFKNYDWTLDLDNFVVF